MSQEISDAFRDTFADSFREVVQQFNCRLGKTVRTETGLTGKSKQIQFVNPVNSTETTGQRYKKVTLADLDIDQRWYYPREFQTPTGESKWDENRLAPTVMPDGAHVKSHRTAFNRDCDSIIIEAALGTAYTGKAGTTETSLPSTQIVPVDFVHTGSDTDSSITAPKIIEAVRILRGNEAWNEDVAAMGEKLWCVLDADLEAQLRQEANKPSGDRLYSADFAPPLYDQNGFLSSWLGVHFVTYNSLATASVTGASGSVTAKKVPLYTSSAIEFGIWGGFSTTIDRRPDLSNAVQFLSQYSLGAGREQEKKVTQINCIAS